MGKSLRLGLRSQISRIIQHHVKLRYLPATDPRNAWRRTIRQAREEIARILDDSPSLRPEVAAMIAKETRRSIELAIRDLEEHDEISRLQMPAWQRARYTEEQVLGDWFAEEPKP